MGIPIFLLLLTSALLKSFLVVVPLLSSLLPSVPPYPQFTFTIRRGIVALGAAPPRLWLRPPTKLY